MLSDQLSELPRINYRRSNMHPYRYAYGTGTDFSRPRGFIDRLVKVDIHEREERVWKEAACYPGEPVFVPSPESRGSAEGTEAGAEDAGIILSVVLDIEKERSFLLVLDAPSFTEIARCEVPHHIPLGFHGNFF